MAQYARSFLANLPYHPYTKDKEYIDSTYYHIVRSGYYSIEKGKRLLEYYPRYTLLETVEESVAYMASQQ